MEDSKKIEEDRRQVMLRNIERSEARQAQLKIEEEQRLILKKKQAAEKHEYQRQIQETQKKIQEDQVHHLLEVRHHKEQ